MRSVIGFAFALAFLTLPAFAAAQFPALSGRVVDDAHILNADTIQQLTTVLSAHEQRAGEQVVVVTVPDLQGKEIEDYGYQLGRAWGIGQKGKNNGALIIVAPTERKTRIEVGYGLEGKLTDAATATIISRLMLPAFRNGDYNDGVLKGTQGVLNALGDPGDDADTTASVADTQQDAPSLLHYLPIIFFLLFILSRFSRRRSGLGPFVIGSMLGGMGGGFGGDGRDSFGGGGGSFGGGGASGSW